MKFSANKLILSFALALPMLTACGGGGSSTHNRIPPYSVIEENGNVPECSSNYMRSYQTVEQSFADYEERVGGVRPTPRMDSETLDLALTAEKSCLRLNRISKSEPRCISVERSRERVLSIVQFESKCVAVSRRITAHLKSQQLSDNRPRATYYER